MNKNHKYDYIIIGGGLAGMQLALAFSEDIFFEDKSIAIIEPQAKFEQENSWSFWEKGEGKWEDIIYKKWSKGKFISKTKSYNLKLDPFDYKTIRSADFFRFVKEKLELSDNVNWIQDSVVSVDELIVIGATNRYTAEFIFDSRVNPNFISDEKSITVQQHFKGWVVETEKESFIDDSFTMMDYSLPFNNDCFFTYVLPFSKKQALVEATFFTPDLVEDSVYNQLLETYISEQLGISNYKIVEEEQGNIPMSTFPFWKENKSNYLKIGTGGGWVKASSGYSFKNVEKKVAQVIVNLKFDNDLDYNLINKKYLFYDKVFLNVLFHENELGPQIFEEMYRKNSTEKIFNFLDEETTFATEIKIMNRFSKAPFIRALRKVIR